MPLLRSATGSSEVPEGIESPHRRLGQLDDDTRRRRRSALTGRCSTGTHGYEYEANRGGVVPRGLPLTTPAGVGIGSTVGHLRAAYGEAVRRNIGRFVSPTGTTKVALWLPTVSETASVPIRGHDLTSDLQRSALGARRDLDPPDEPDPAVRPD